MAIAPTRLSWEPTFKWKNHLYHHSPPHASFPRIQNPKNLKKLSIKCFFTAANSRRNECFTSGRKINKNGLGKTEIKQNPIEIVAKAIVNALKALQKSAAAAVLVGLLLMYNPYNNSALAASGGRMGGSSFSSRSSSGGGKSHSFSSGSSSKSYSSPSMSFRSSSVSDLDSDSVTNSKSNSANSTSHILLILFALELAVLLGHLYIVLEIKKAEETSVLKLQVGLVGSAKSLQKDLNRIAETADTSTPKGLHYVLTETVLALLRHPDYFISAYSSVDLKKSMKKGEKRFNQLSIEERGKFDEETLVNVNNIKKQSTKSIRAGEFRNEYIVITILVAAEGGLKLPTINNSNDLKEALQKIASIPSRRTLAVEVLWTPQNEDDTLSERQLLEDYPFLRPL